MPDEVNRDLGRLEGRLDEFIAARVARDKRTDERFDRLEEKIQGLLDAANMGKGAWWLSVKIGGVMVTVGAGITWVLTHAVSFIPR
jgi:hypothetical protein